MGVINLIIKCMSKLNIWYHCTNAGFCAKKWPKSAKRPPETLDIIM